MDLKEKRTNFRKELLYGIGQRDAKGRKIYSMLQLALFIFVSSTVVFVTAAGVSYRMIQKKTESVANDVMNKNMALATEIINRHLMSVENSGYSLASTFLKEEIIKDENGKRYPRFIFEGSQEDSMSVKQLYSMLEKFVKANPHLWGAAIGFEPFIYPQYGDKGVAPFVRHTNDTLYEHLSLPDMRNNYREADWYKTTKELGKPRWCQPFTDVKGAVITCFCIPIYARNGMFIGAVAVDLMLKGFSDDLKREIRPYKDSQVMVIGPRKRFLVHPDQSCVMTSSIESIEKFKQETEDQGSILYYKNIESNQMTIAISCPKEEIYAPTYELLNKLLLYAALGLLLVEICCFITFSALRRMFISKASIEGELNIASNIQMSMLPLMFPAFPDRKEIDLAASLKPAKSVGGDLYDYIINKNEEGHDSLVFAIGDVSGKGVPASLLMAVVCNLFRNMATKTTDPRLIAIDINDCISERNEYDMFCTMFLGSLDMVTGKLTYCNAGHNQPVIMKKGKAQFVDVIPNIPLGAFGGFEYQSEEMQMDCDDTLFIYTDGVTEAENINHEEYSDERLIGLLNNIKKTNSIDIVGEVAQSVSMFAGKAEQSDDITMLAVKFIKPFNKA